MSTSPKDVPVCFKKTTGTWAGYVLNAVLIRINLRKKQMLKRILL